MNLFRSAAGAAVLFALGAASFQPAAAWETRRSHDGFQSAWRNDYAEPSRRIHQSGNSCAPDRAEPVWGPGNALMGYSCETASANGS